MERIGQTSSAANAEAVAADGSLAWRRLGRSDWAALVALAAVVVIIAAPQLPTCVCMGDAGDLQLAATVLGIPHPPGYAAYVSLAHLVTYVPGVDPAYLVSVCCTCVGVVAAVLCALLAIRMGADPWAASAIALALTGHSRFWQNLTTPEVYIYSIAFLAAAGYALIRYAFLGRLWSLYSAAFLYGVAMANRPPILMAAPFFVAGWWIARRRWEVGAAGTARSLAWILLAALTPVAYSFAYLYVRDTPQTRYNYVERYNAESGDLPDTQAGFRPKIERVVWMATGKQFHDRAGNTGKQIRTKLRWLRGELAGAGTIAPLAAGLMAAVGAFLTFRRSPAAMVTLCGIALQGAAFVLTYQDFGQAADILPILIPLTVFIAVATSALFAGRSRRTRSALALAIVLVVGLYTFRDLPDRPRYGQSVDASDFLQKTQLATFPPGSVIFTDWTYALPLLYEREVRTDRKDIDIVFARPLNWLQMGERFGERPMFAVRKGSWLRGRELTEFRNMWRLGPGL